MEKSNCGPERGYAALMSTLIICTVLTVLAIQSGTSVYFARLSALEAEYRAIGYGLAHSCAQVVLFELSADPTYRPKPAGDEVWLDPERNCRIESVTETDTGSTLVVSGRHENFKTVLEIRIEEDAASRPPFHIISFREI